MTPIIPPHAFFPRNLTEVVFLLMPRASTDTKLMFTSWVTPGHAVSLNIQLAGQGKRAQTVCELKVEGWALRALYGEDALEWRTINILPSAVFTKIQQRGWSTLKLTSVSGNFSLTPDFSETLRRPYAMTLISEEGEALHLSHRQWCKGESTNVIEIAHAKGTIRTFDLNLMPLAHALQPGLESWFTQSMTGNLSLKTPDGHLSARSGQLTLPWRDTLRLKINARRMQQLRRLLFSPPQP